LAFFFFATFLAVFFVTADSVFDFLADFLAAFFGGAFFVFFDDVFASYATCLVDFFLRFFAAVFFGAIGAGTASGAMAAVFWVGTTGLLAASPIPLVAVCTISSNADLSLSSMGTLH
jgi:hypothetical protein